MISSTSALSYFFSFSLVVITTKLEVTEGQFAFPATIIPSPRTFFTQQTYPWGFSYSFSEVGNHHNILKAKSTTNLGFLKNNLIVPVPAVPLGISLTPRLNLIPLPILRKVNVTTSIPNGDDKAAESSLTTTTTMTSPSTTVTTTLPLETQKSSETPTGKENGADTLSEIPTPTAGFFYGHLSSPLTFSYGFTTFGKSPLAIPHLQKIGLNFNSQDNDILTNLNKNKNDNEEEPKSVEDISKTTSKTVGNDSEKADDITDLPMDHTEPESEHSEPTTQTNRDNEDEEPNLETETFSPLQSKKANIIEKQNDGSFAPKKLESDSDSTTDINTTVPPTLSSTVQSDNSNGTSKSELSYTSTGNKSEFSYSIKDEITLDEKSHEEQRDGDSVKGKYSVVEPDGALRTVTYVADESGFKADVVRKESYAKPFPVFQNSITRPPGGIQSLSNQNVLSYYYDGFHIPPPNPADLRNFRYGYNIILAN